MPEITQRRVIVFDRIDSNRRATLLLSGISALAMIPVVAGLSFYLTGLVGIFLGGLMLMADPEPELRMVIATYIVVMVAIAVILVTAALYIQYWHSDRIALRMSRAKPLGRDRERRLWDTVEGLCVGTGLPLPKLYVVETEVPNAFSVGLSPERSSLVVTRGLLSLLDPRELEGVLAHEISHIGNQDIRLNTTVAAMGAILRLPFRLMTAPIRFLFHVHWLLGAGALFLIGRMFLLSFTHAGGLSSFNDLDPADGLGTLALVGTGVFLYSFLVAPLIGLIFPLAISRRRELLADADAARLTLNPPSLARALAKIAGGANSPMKGSHAMAHLYIVDPPGAGQWWKGILSTHPPVIERIELLAGMGDGILPEIVEGRKPEAGEPPRGFPAPSGEPTLESVVSDGEPEAGFLDAALYGIAVGTAAVAVLAVANIALLLLGTGNFPVGKFMPFHLPAALAAGFSAQKRGTAGIIALGFALLVFVLSGIFQFLSLAFLSDPNGFPREFPPHWIVWFLASDIAVVVMLSVAGASLDRWCGWVKAFFGILTKRAG